MAKSTIVGLQEAVDPTRLLAAIIWAKRQNAIRK